MSLPDTIKNCTLLGVIYSECKKIETVKMNNIIFLLFLSFKIFVYSVEASQKGKYIF